MKVIIRKTDALALYTYEDTESVILENSRIIDSLAVDASLGKDDVVLYTNVQNVPTDFAPGKYIFNGTDWVVNQKFSTREVRAANLKSRDTGKKLVSKGDKLLDKDAERKIKAPKELDPNKQ